MPLQLYNTRTRSVEPFVPLRDGAVRVYVCGLTPSAQAHIGHARSFLFFDVLRRYLTHCGYKVTYVQNVTDIDDRSIERARETGERWYDIVSGYYAGFKESMRRLGVREPDVEPYATAFIEPILATIAKLVEAGYAYPTSQGVYYRVSAFPRYGALANRNVAELRSGARVEVDQGKRDPLDFALWKFAKPGEPSWPSPWGDGRPGWHIECSAMARALLDPPGEGFDIHGGGADLIFPHHENEIAQSEPLMNRPPMANVWMHGGLLLYENKKMSKSLGNFEPLGELLDRHDSQAIRVLFLQTGYRKVMNFTEESVTAAAVVLEKLKKTYRELRESAPAAPGATPLMARIEGALDDDMNTAVALAALLDAGSSTATLSEYVAALDVLGLTPDESWRGAASADLPAELAAMLELRDRARADKNWVESDRLRDELLARGIELKDSKEGTTWTVVG
ncbi:MAG TPA: cysteine--tRNA ligase [Candidatus Baltobacteraceae bacterium]